jgi:hypothetical protein
MVLLMIKQRAIQPSVILRHVSQLFLVAALGLGLGLSEWNLMDFVSWNAPWMLNWVFPVLGLGWVYSIFIYSGLLIISAKYAFGVTLKIQKLITALTLWLFTTLGGIGFFYMGGMDYMTWEKIVSGSAYLAAIYNFGLILLPLFLLWVVNQFWKKVMRTHGGDSGTALDASNSGYKVD